MKILKSIGLTIFYILGSVVLITGLVGILEGGSTGNKQQDYFIGICAVILIMSFFILMWKAVYDSI